MNLWPPASPFRYRGTLIELIERFLSDQLSYPAFFTAFQSVLFWPKDPRAHVSESDDRLFREIHEKLDEVSWDGYPQNDEEGYYMSHTEFKAWLTVQRTTFDAAFE